MLRLVSRLLMSVTRFRPSPETIVLGMCGLVLLAVAIPAIMQTRERARLQATKEKMRQIGAGVLSYHDTFLSFPSSPAGKPQRPEAKPNESPQLISPLVILGPGGR